MAANPKAKFPCPVCASPCDVRQTKKNKPYIICDGCGIQLFIRGPAGINAFNRLVEEASNKDVWARLADMERRYHLKCPKCATRFWAEPQQIQTSMFDGSFKGFGCPKCGATVEWEKKA
jgi:ssDNA-binding Zn-finger/Zn-ribbon topoisomerase 1